MHEPKGGRDHETTDYQLVPPNSTGKAQGREKQIYPLGVLSDQSSNRGYIFLTNHSEAVDMFALDAILPRGMTNFPHRFLF